MLELICKRLLLAVPTLLLVSMMVFGLQKLLPGDPLIAMAGEERDPAVIAQLLRIGNPAACSQVCMPVSCPSAAMRRTSSGCRSAFAPTRKNVALTPLSRSRSSTRGVISGSGPSSNVSATTRPAARLRHSVRTYAPSRIW